MWLEDRELALEAQHRCRDERAAAERAGVGEQEAGREIIGAVAYDIVLRDEIRGIIGTKPQRMCLDRDVRD